MSEDSIDLIAGNHRKRPPETIKTFILEVYAAGFIFTFIPGERINHSKGVSGIISITVSEKRLVKIQLRRGVTMDSETYRQFPS